MTTENLKHIYDILMEVKNIRKIDKDELVKKDWDEFLLHCALLNPQSYGAIIERKFRDVNKLKKIPANKNKGDAFNPRDGKNYEIKASYSGNDGSYNLVQIRPWQNVDYYILLIDIKDEKVIKKLFVLTHEEMLNEVELLGGTAHGTTSIITEDVHVEKRITLVQKDIERWENTYYNKNEFII